MTDKELADAVELILGFNPVDMFGDDWDTDWRVAGALMEIVDTGQLTVLHCASGKWRCQVPNKGRMGSSEAFNESLPRAIIEACVEALK